MVRPEIIERSKELQKTPPLERIAAMKEATHEEESEHMVRPFAQGRAAA